MSSTGFVEILPNKTHPNGCVTVILYPLFHIDRFPKNNLVLMGKTPKVYVLQWFTIKSNIPNLLWPSNLKLIFFYKICYILKKINFIQCSLTLSLWVQVDPKKIQEFYIICNLILTNTTFVFSLSGLIWISSASCIWPHCPLMTKHSLSLYFSFVGEWHESSSHIPPFHIYIHFALQQ